MEANLWWVWMIVAAIFIVGEIFTAGFFLLWFGIGAACAGLIALSGFRMVWQLLTFVVLSLALFSISRRFAERLSNQQPPGIGANRFIGAECVVLEQIDNLNNTGRVRMGKEEWRAESENGVRIEKGRRVAVTRMSGTHLVVKTIEEGE